MELEVFNKSHRLPIGPFFFWLIFIYMALPRAVLLVSVYHLDHSYSVEFSHSHLMRPQELEEPSSQFQCESHPADIR